MRSPLVLFAAALVAGCAPAVTVQSPPPSGGPPPRANPSASVHTLGIPPGHLPRPGQCRIWVPGTPPGRQQRAGSCQGITARAPAGSWILYRPSRDPAVVHVHVVDNVRAGVVVVIRLFNAESGAYIREEEPNRHHDEYDDEGDGHGRGQGHQR